MLRLQNKEHCMFKEECLSHSCKALVSPDRVFSIHYCWWPKLLAILGSSYPNRSNCVFIEITGKYICVCCNKTYSLRHLFQYVLELDSELWLDLRYSNSYMSNGWEFRSLMSHLGLLSLIQHVLLLLKPAISYAQGSAGTDRSTREYNRQNNIGRIFLFVIMYRVQT